MKRVAAGLAMALILAACGGTTQPVATQAPVQTAPVEAPATTLEEAASHRAAGQLERYERDLHALSRSADVTTSRRALALLGLMLYDQKRYADAVPVLTQAADRYPEVASSLRLRVLESEEQRGNFQVAVTAAEQIVQSAPRSAAAAIAEMRLPGLYAALRNTAATDAAWTTISTRAIDELTEDEWVRLADTLAKHQRTDLATAIRMRLLTQYTSGRWTEKVYGQIANATPSPFEAMDYQKSLDLANALSRANRLDQALDLLTRIGTRFPEAQTQDLYQSVRLRSLFNSRNYTQLVSETSWDTMTDPALILLRARAAWRGNQPQLFLDGLSLLEQKFPKSKEAVEAKVQRAKYYVTDDVNYTKSTADMQAAINAGSVGNDGENIWSLGWTYTLWGIADKNAGSPQFGQALKTFDRYIKAYPNGDYKTNSLFWTAKIHERRRNLEGRDAALRAIIAEYPYSYYAYRSREILGLPTVAPSSVDNGNRFPDVNAALKVVPPEQIVAVDELMAIGLNRDATREMKRISAAYPDNAGVSFKLADVYVRGGEPFRANGILQRSFRPFVRHGGAGVPQRFWEILFPLAYWDEVRVQAEKQRVDPYQMVAIIRQESGFEPATVSTAGAVGLMQIMPAEAERLGTAAGLPGITRESLFDPTTNIAVGAAEFRQKLDRMQDNTMLATAAYNAGETAVGRWLAQTPVDDIDLFVEAIPYAETRLYVKTVTRNRFEYRRIYDGSSAAPEIRSAPRTPPPSTHNTPPGTSGNGINATAAQPHR